MTPTASIVIPTRGRPAYLDVALRSIVPQAERAGAEVVVVSDGDEEPTADVATRHGVKLVRLAPARGANAARNAGAGAALGDLLVFVDDDIEAPRGWLQALLEGAQQCPGHEAFGGPIKARLEGGGPRACGREAAPITTLDHGASDRDVDMVWSANMALRRSAFERIGQFDEALAGCGEEEDWLRRLHTAGGHVRYLAAAGVDHRRTAADATIRSLARSAYQRGRAARRYDAHRGEHTSARAELRVLAGCVWHTLRRRCGNGPVLAAHSAGRLLEALSPEPAIPSEDFLSGTSGYVAGIRATSRAIVRDALADAVALGALRQWRLRRAARTGQRRSVLVLAVERTGIPNLLDSARTELLRSRHEVEFARIDAGTAGKWENLRMLLERHPAESHDWLVVIDDDVTLPAGFLDSFIFLAERFELTLAQPAHRHRSHAAWEVTRRRATTLVRETAFVEIGPVFAFAARAFDELLPFPTLRVGWGLELHWSAVARRHHWKLGVVDATPILHALRPVASAYDRADALAETREFLSERPYTKAAQAQRTLVSHRSWR